MGVVFFLSLPFIGVILFPSFVLGNASGEGGTFPVPLSLFSVLLSLPSPFFSFFFSFILSFFLSSFLPHLILLFFFFPVAQTLSIPFFFFSSFPPFYSSSPIFHLCALLPVIFISFSFPLSFLKAFFFVKVLSYKS